MGALLVIFAVATGCDSSGEATSASDAGDHEVVDGASNDRHVAQTEAGDVYVGAEGGVTPDAENDAPAADGTDGTSPACGPQSNGPAAATVAQSAGFTGPADLRSSGFGLSIGSRFAGTAGNDPASRNQCER
jgi:hypothetical protein